MLGPRQTPKPQKESHIHTDKLMSKLLMRVVSEIQSRGALATPELMDQARRDIERCWESHQGKLSDRDLKQVVSGLLRQTRAKSAMETTSQQQQQSSSSAAAVAKARTPPSEPAHSSNHNDDAYRSEARSTSPSAADLQSLLKNTTKKQREMIADADWVRAAEEDRVNGALMKRKERQDKVDFMARQRNILDEQIDEHNRQKREEQEARMRRQREMTEHIENHRRLTREERQAAHDKAMREKAVRDQQAKELEEARERQRQEEHDEQMRQYLLVQEELRKQREKELNQKLQKQSEWKQVLSDNQKKLQEKDQQKQREREIDRDFQRQFTENLDRTERERAEDKARKEARATYFQQLANGVASLFMQKEQDLSAKIEAEYQEQLRRAQEDERNRKRALKDRTLDCLEVQKAQCEEKRREKEREREESRRLAEALTEQIAEAKRQEQARKAAERAEAQRMREFLNTQLQLQHFKETRPLETSIARPASRAQTMYSPSRYTPSPVPAVLPKK